MQTQGKYVALLVVDCNFLGMQSLFLSPCLQVCDCATVYVCGCVCTSVCVLNKYLVYVKLTRMS